MSSDGRFLRVDEIHGYFVHFGPTVSDPQREQIIVYRLESISDGYVVTEILYEGPDDPTIGFIGEIVYHIPIEEVPPLAVGGDTVARMYAMERLASPGGSVPRNLGLWRR